MGRKVYHYHGIHSAACYPFMKKTVFFIFGIKVCVGGGGGGGKKDLNQRRIIPIKFSPFLNLHMFTTLISASKLSCCGMEREVKG